jgi:hypothetical protein
MFRQERAHIANDSDCAGDAYKIAESPQCSDGIVQDGGGVAPGNDLVDDKAIKKRADDSDARVSEFVCSSGIHRASLRLCKFGAAPNRGPIAAEQAALVPYAPSYAISCRMRRS